MPDPTPAGIDSDVAHDVFISYASKDNLPRSEGAKGWVQSFDEQLTTLLIQGSGRTPSVWRDDELLRTEEYRRAIRRAVQGSRTMILLVSRSFLNSEFCQQEIAWFTDHHDDLLVGDARRIVPVLLYNLPKPDWPEASKGVVGHRFYTGDWPTDPESKEFEQKLQALAVELLAILEADIEQSRPAEPEPEVGDPGADAEADGPSQTVFVAAAADDVRKDRRRLVRALEAMSSVRVVPPIPKPYPSAQHEAALMGVDAGLWVHILGRTTGEDLEEPTDEEPTDTDGADAPDSGASAPADKRDEIEDGADAEPAGPAVDATAEADEEPAPDFGAVATTYPLAQLGIGLSRAPSQLILLPNDFTLPDLEDEGYRRWIAHLQGRKRTERELEIAKVERSHMLSVVEAKLDSLRSPAPVNGGAPVTFVDFHPSDLLAASKLVPHLMKQMQLVMVPGGDIGPASLELFEKNLAASRLYLIVLGNAARAWVDDRISTAMRLIYKLRLQTNLCAYVDRPEISIDELIDGLDLDLDFSTGLERFIGPLTGLLGRLQELNRSNGSST